MAKKKAKFKREIVAVKLFVDPKGNKRVVAVKLASPRVTKDYRISYRASAHDMDQEIKSDISYFYINPSNRKKTNKVKVVSKKNPKKSYVLTKDSDSEIDNLLKLPHFQ